MKPIYVIGHKNPDLDSIAAAVSYKVFKQSTADGLYIAAAASEINDDHQALLEELDFEVPVVLKNVRTRVEDLLESKKALYVSTDTSLMELVNLIRRNDLKTIPVLGEQEQFLGLLTIGDVAMIFMDALGSGRDIEKSPEVLRGILDKKVADIMKTRGLVLFEKDEPVDEARKQMLSTRYRNYPVVDEDNRFLGLISRYNLLQMKRKQLILVDHNEKKQAVEGIEEAEVLEIIDHHRVGDLQTISPIYFRNEPVGSTSTLIVEIFLEHGIFLSRNMALLLLSGIMSDTMIFKSPTTTSKDKRMAARLQDISGVDPAEWGKYLFARTGRLDSLTDEEILLSDLKEYVSGDYTFAIAQFETIDLDKFADRRSRLLDTMARICAQKNYALMCLMATDIFEEATDMIVAGDKKYLVEDAFEHDHRHGSIYLKGVMSRKKQVVPVIYEALRKETLM
ncbi:MAG TPA: putative manganese-dependent inorganic diphosphatase [Syntrophomonadaceae bacterium]|nr:putative manganese-dependent inorganic diphosphatase [Syntrophomonadaceae bacterium]